MAVSGRAKAVVAVRTAENAKTPIDSRLGLHDAAGPYCRSDGIAASVIQLCGRHNGINSGSETLAYWIATTYDDAAGVS
jgi:hypothetical protein